MRLLSIRHYAIALMHGLDPRRFADFDHVSLAAAIIVSILMFATDFWFSIRRLHRMDVP